MAFPFVSENHFDVGTLGHFDSETDTESRLDFPHFSTLAKLRPALAPFSGSYCMRVDLRNDGTPADAFVTETSSWDMTAGTGELYGRFQLYLSDDVTMANGDEFAILLFHSAGPVIECGIYINYTTANGLRLGTGQDTSAASQFAAITTGRWHTVEFFFDPAGGAASTFDCWLNGTALTQQTGFTSADITQGVVGVLSQDATTTAGTVLFDHIVTDDARLGLVLDRFPFAIPVTASRQLFVGPGCVDIAQMLSSTSGEALKLYDTDDASSTAGEIIDGEGFSGEISVDGLKVLPMPVYFHRGCYASLSGTNPRAIVTLARGGTHNDGNWPSPKFYSATGIVEYGKKRAARNVTAGF